MELATGVVGVFLLVIQILFPESVTVASIFNLFVVGLIWVSYKIAKILHAIDLRLLVIAFSCQLFVVWVVGIFTTMIFAASVMVILATVSIILDINFVLIFVFIMFFIITIGSRKAAKSFAVRRWSNMLTEDYKALSINQRYTDTALASVERCLPHPFIAFLLFFLIFWMGQPDLLASLQIGPLVALLAFYTMYKGALYLSVQKKENTEW